MASEAIVQRRTAWWYGLVATDRSVAPLVLRLGLAAMMFPHGAQKLLGWWGGPGPDATVAGMAHLGVAPFWAWCAILVEFVCPILLAVGFLVRPAALLIGFEILVGVVLTHQSAWISGKGGAGLDFHSLIWAISLALIAAGAGAASIDRAIAATRDEPPAGGLTWRRATVAP